VSFQFCFEISSVKLIISSNGPHSGDSFLIVASQDYNGCMYMASLNPHRVVLNNKTEFSLPVSIKAELQYG